MLKPEENKDVLTGAEKDEARVELLSDSMSMPFTAKEVEKEAEEMLVEYAFLRKGERLAAPSEYPPHEAYESLVVGTRAEMLFQFAEFLKQRSAPATSDPAVAGSD